MSPLVSCIPDDTEALIFDLDGTLADTMPLHWQAWRDCLHEETGMPVPHGLLSPFAGIPSYKIVLELNRVCGTNLDPQTFSNRKQKRFRELLPGVKPITQVADLVDHYRGVYPMAIASGGTRQNIDLTLHELGMKEDFDVILSADDPIPHKPAPHLFLEAARRLKAEPARCVVLEDADAGLDAGRAAGMHVIDVREVTGTTTQEEEKSS